MGKRDDLDVRREHGADFYHKIVLDDGVLKGAIFVGACRNEGFTVQLIRQQVDVSPFADSLLRGTFRYPRYVHEVLKI